MRPCKGCQRQQQEQKQRAHDQCFNVCGMLFAWECSMRLSSSAYDCNRHNPHELSQGQVCVSVDEPSMCMLTTYILCECTCLLMLCHNYCDIQVRELGRGSFGSVWLAKWRGVEVRDGLPAPPFSILSSFDSDVCSKFEMVRSHGHKAANTILLASVAACGHVLCCNHQPWSHRRIKYAIVT